MPDGRPRGPASRRTSPPRHARPRATLRQYRLRRTAAIGAAVVLVVVIAVVAHAASGPHASVAHLRARSARAPQAVAKGGSGRPAVSPPAGTHVAPQGVVASWVQAENAKPGTRDWVVTKPATNHQIEGYADQVSIDAGGHLALYVSTSAPSYQVMAYRMGYYGGSQGRLVWTSPTTPGKMQPGCPVDTATRTVQCQWTDPLQVQTGVAGWPQGDYLFKLTSSDGYQSYVPLTIRDDTSHSAYLINNSVTDWQAYNEYGHYSLYTGPTRSGGMALADRAYTVSFDRPYDFTEGDGSGSADFSNEELRMVSAAESLGLDVSYATDVDLDVRPAMVLQHRAFVALGHDEYYSLAMRNGLQAARDAGVNLLFMGANSVYRHIRLQPSPLGHDRQEVDYKDASLDPVKDPAQATPAAWRAPPNNDPESSLLGEMWRCDPVNGDMVIIDPSNWIMAGTGLAAGAKITGAISAEYDSYRAADPGPKNVEIVGRSPITCVGRFDHADTTYYTAPSGAGVFDSGSIGFIAGLVTDPQPGTPAAYVTTMTKNLLATFGQGPAGRTHPSVPNASAYPGG
ncbi:MAG: hypothetical protein M3Y91_19460 [Actinomycetota bacterium]|nr:hypothetical protein [Actinomycetota bacterium]